MSLKLAEIRGYLVVWNSWGFSLSVHQIIICLFRKRSKQGEAGADMTIIALQCKGRARKAVRKILN